MERDQVLSIVDALANGIDPHSGARIPHETFHSEEVVQALAAAATLLRGAPDRPASAGARWSEQEDALLCHAFDSGTPIAAIAREHGRSRAAITLRLVKLGRVDPASVKTRQRGATLVS